MKNVVHSDPTSDAPHIENSFFALRFRRDGWNQKPLARAADVTFHAKLSLFAQNGQSSFSSAARCSGIQGRIQDLLVEDNPDGARFQL